MQMPSSFATSTDWRSCLATICTTPALNASSYRDGTVPVFSLFPFSFFLFSSLLPFFPVCQFGYGGSDKRFAVIVDEAYSSQTGESSKK